MQITTTVSIPKNLAQEVEDQVEGEVSWEILAAPFRVYAKQKKLTEQDILRIVEKGRHVKSSKNSK